MCALPRTTSTTGLVACKQLSHDGQASRRQIPSLCRSRSVQALSCIFEPDDERRDLLVTFAYILCRYPRAPQAEDDLIRMPLDAFSEAHSPLNSWSHDLRPETAFHLVASLVHGLDLDTDCIVHALLLLERLGRDVLRVLLAEDLWRNTVIMAFVIATKLAVDEATWLEDVRDVLLYYGYKAGRLRRQELLFLKLIDYEANMTRTQFTIYLLSMKSVGRSEKAQQLFRDHDYMSRFRSGSHADCTASLDRCRLRGRML
ncbi:hypothetical protein AB1Y20_006551 [Prymnesium parvum]|uniref:Cyclin N-terminal domain-containing protein n=1 Tax=Prymnesium parvum TaxID=97485 RepID=A0AB34J0M6_PRYPA|mmetsp:Transcript_32815/g.68775  ORF Transcript_32815/g.68775 Transcript_32815/m.68775 type:complete len:258 (+) Transcript_32815:62-835(+)